MDSGTVDENFEVLEWRIKNLCFWNKEIHGTILEQYYSGIDLFPRGLEGNGEHLVLRIHDTSATYVEASFVGSDGSLLCKQHINDPKWEGGYEELPPGPKFEEIVQARKKNPDNEDTLTIICRLKKLRGLLYRAETELVALDISIRVPNETLKDIPFGQPKFLSNINYPKEDEGHNALDLIISSAPDDTIFSFTLDVHQASEEVLIHTSLSLRDTNDSVIKYEENEHFFPGAEKWIVSDKFQKKEVIENGYSLIISLKVITGVIEGNKIYSISIKQDSEILIPPSNVRKSKNPSAQGSIDLLSKELMNLYQDQDYADFQLQCVNVTFATHRGILSARSPVFKSMLSSGMKETESGFMEITDLDVSTLGRFLAFLYSGAVEDLQWENALKLYYSADKYQVPSLKNECRRVFISSISTSNVCRILSLANQHQDEDLLSITHQFVSEKDYEVLKSEEWETFMLDEPYLASKTLTRIVLGKSTQKGMME